MMKKKRQSALILTGPAWEILAKHRGVYGVKSTMSVGLELFDALSVDEQVRRVRASSDADVVMRHAEADATKLNKKRRQKRPREESA